MKTLIALTAALVVASNRPALGADATTLLPLCDKALGTCRATFAPYEAEIAARDKLEGTLRLQLAEAEKRAAENAAKTPSSPLLWMTVGVLVGGTALYLLRK